VVEVVMTRTGLAYSTLLMLLEDWAEENIELVRHPEYFAEYAAKYCFEELLGVRTAGIDNEG
jgi:hypothetical protein